MLLYLAFHPEGATVEKLADSLLPDTALEQSRSRLWQSASEARRILGDGLRRNDDGRYEVNRESVRIDIDDLERLLASATRTDGLPHSGDLEDALTLFRGAPLDGVDFAWAEGHGRHLRATYVDLIEQVGRIRLESGDAGGALNIAERGLEMDKLNEGLWRLVMEADYAVGLRDSVSLRYHHLRDLLNDELGLEPEAETRSLYLNLLGQR